jgi:hypothetical protein
MPYLFAPGLSAEWIVDRLDKNRWLGEIIGPHGSGKSSLLAAIRPAIEQTGRPTVLIELHDGQRRLPVDPAADDRFASPAVVLVDGYEQLNRWNRSRLKRGCQRRGLGLLVTAHQSVGLPLLFHTEPTVAMAEAIVAQLLEGRNPLDASSIRESYNRHHGDLREMLFDLYDLYE